MKCSNCGFENKEGSPSCIVCGNSLIKKEKNIKKIINNERNTSQNEYKSDANDNTRDNTRKKDADTLNDNNSSSNNQHNNNQFVKNEDSNPKFYQSQNKHNQKNEFQSSAGNIGDELKNSKNDINKKINGFFSTRNITIICIIVILLTLAGCAYALYLNDVKHYYNEDSRYDPEYRYSCDFSEYNQTSYTFDEIYTAYTPTDAKMEMFEESDVNGDGILKGNEITKMDYKLKHSKYARTYQY